MPEKECRQLLSRRDMLFATGTGILSVIHSGLELPVTFAAETEIDAWMESKLKGVHVKADRITLDIPEVAENGSSVQFTVTVDSPMTEQDYVKEVHVFAEGNATPYVASYYFTPYSGKAQVTARLRLAKKQYVRVLATMSNGSSYMTRKEVTVAIGGC